IEKLNRYFVPTAMFDGIVDRFLSDAVEIDSGVAILDQDGRGALKATFHPGYLGRRSDELTESCFQSVLYFEWSKAVRKRAGLTNRLAKKPAHLGRLLAQIGL